MVDKTIPLVTPDGGITRAFCRGACCLCAVATTSPNPQEVVPGTSAAQNAGAPPTIFLGRQRGQPRFTRTTDPNHCHPISPQEDLVHITSRTRLGSTSHPYMPLPSLTTCYRTRARPHRSHDTLHVAIATFPMNSLLGIIIFSMGSQPFAYFQLFLLP